MREQPMPPVAEGACLRCGEPLQRGQALASLYQVTPGVTWEGPAEPPKLRDCLKCPACGYSETLPCPDQ